MQSPSMMMMIIIKHKKKVHYCQIHFRIRGALMIFKVLLMLRTVLLMLMYLCIRKKVEVNLNPSLEVQKSLNLNLEPQENQEVEKTEIEEIKPLDTRIKIIKNNKK